ncbi:MAG: glutamate-5-semialdehyde dehydrogenase [Clostridia bacterium]|nr:glutamate-5-semialdehyde dehydrogenase [Clostridia bacterium]
MSYLDDLGLKAKKASKQIAVCGTDIKNKLLCEISKQLLENADYIVGENKKDVEIANKNNMKESLVDRLLLDNSRIRAISDAVMEIAALKDPVGEVLSAEKRPNGLLIAKKRVPIGVIGIIYEARPNVTVDAAALCIKAGSAVVLRGGSDAINSNKAIVLVIKKAILNLGLDENIVTLVEDTSRETASQLMKLNKYIDVLIPRGGAGLIKSVVDNATVPVIETGSGNCHVYVDEFADIQMAKNIIVNAKTQRIGVCNAAESLLVHEKIAHKALPVILNALVEKGVEIRGCEKTLEIFDKAVLATENDFYEEYLDLIISVKIVKDIDEAICHIDEHSTGHSETIITDNYNNALKFTNEVDSAAVYVNASTRFTDGGEFGFGAEIGISTQKLHARGPMGLKEITTYKYVILGDGQIR